MKRIASLLILACAAAAHSDVVHLTVYYAGNKVGENTFERKADGTVESKTLCHIGAVEINSQLNAKFEKDKLISYSVDTVQGPREMKLAYANGTLKSTPGTGKTTEVQYDASKPLLMGGLHPRFTRDLLKVIDYAKKVPQPQRVYLIDSGAELAVTVKPMASKTLTVAGTAEETKYYSISVNNIEFILATNSKGEIEGMDVPTQKLRFVAPGWETAFADPLAAYPELSQPTFTVRVEKGLKASMRDGVKLAADVYRPKGDAKVPTILVRTPYGRELETPAGEFYARRGYAYVVQDCRGRNDSEGEWDPFVNERKDGYDSVQWVAAQPWSDGKVGMIGASYGGYVQWSAAVELPPALKCIIPQVSPPDAMHNIPYDFGIPFLYGDIWWAKIVKDKKADLSGVGQLLENPEKFAILPLSKVDDGVLGMNVPIYDKWLERPTISDWKGFDYQQDIEKVTIPVLHISGWFDGDEIGTQMNYAALRQIGRNNQWLIYGPWTHAFNTTSKLADLDFGPTAILELDSLYLRWFDTWLKGKEVSIGKVPKVKAFVMGANKWVEMRSWPDDASSTGRTLYLSAPGDATAKGAKGELTPIAPEGQKPTTYTYDPSKDTNVDVLDPKKVGQTTVVKIGHPESDLLFQTAPFTQDTAVSAPYELSLWFSSSAVDTDFFASLLDVDEKGDMRPICNKGKIRASYLGGMDKRVALEPGKPYEAKIKLWDSAFEFKKGHRMALLVSSSAFPMFARNLGTMDPIKDSTKMVIQKNTIYCDRQHPSNLSFRVLWAH